MKTLVDVWCWDDECISRQLVKAQRQEVSETMKLKEEAGRHARQPGVDLQHQGSTQDEHTITKESGTSAGECYCATHSENANPSWDGTFQSICGVIRFGRVLTSVGLGT